MSDRRELRPMSLVRQNGAHAVIAHFTKTIHNTFASIFKCPKQLVLRRVPRWLRCRNAPSAKHRVPLGRQPKRETQFARNRLTAKRQMPNDPRGMVEPNRLPHKITVRHVEHQPAKVFETKTMAI